MSHVLHKEDLNVTPRSISRVNAEIEYALPLSGAYERGFCADRRVAT